MRHARARLIVVIAALAFLTDAAEAQNTVEKFVINSDAARRAKIRDEISLDTARRIADHCLQESGKRNLAASIFILSPSGNVVYALRSDGVTPVGIETALLKAKTALFMRDSTHAWMNRLTQDPDFATRLIPLGQYFNSGGLPIIVNDVLIGSIGVGGMAPTPEWNDEICAHNALTAVLGPQLPLAPFLPPSTGR